MPAAMERHAASFLKNGYVAWRRSYQAEIFHATVYYSKRSANRTPHLLRHPSVDKMGRERINMRRDGKCCWRFGQFQRRHSYFVGNEPETCPETKSLAHLNRWNYLGQCAVDRARHRPCCIMHRFTCNGLICFRQRTALRSQ